MGDCDDVVTGGDTGALLEFRLRANGFRLLRNFRPEPLLA